MASGCFRVPEVFDDVQGLGAPQVAIAIPFVSGRLSQQLESWKLQKSLEALRKAHEGNV